jgi:hypothetical protein
MQEGFYTNVRVIERGLLWLPPVMQEGFYTNVRVIERGLL